MKKFSAIPQKTICYLGLGSNLGDREQFITHALEILKKNPEITIIKTSSIIETEPYGKTAQPQFLNCAVEISTSLKPSELLKICLETENILGRRRKEKWGARKIDLDILFYGDEIINSKDLKIPHPDLQNRAFVLQSLVEICPNYVHPILKKDMNTLFEELNKI